MASSSSRTPETPPASPNDDGGTQPRRYRVKQVWPATDSDSNDSPRRIDIVAIHGLCTRSPKAWEGYINGKDDKDGKINWLEHETMLPTMIDPPPRILTYDWNAELVEGATNDSIFGQAISFLSRLGGYRRRTKTMDRPIIFIASCYGGLLLAAALEYARTDSDEDSHRILHHTVGITFLGTPFRGCAGDWLTVQQLRILIAIQSHETYSEELVMMLQKHHDGDLYHLVGRFCQMVADRKHNFPITCFYENWPTDFNSQQQGLIKKLKNPDLDITKFAVGKVSLVDKRAGTLDSAKSIGLEASHTTLNKFFGPSDPSFESVSNALAGMAEKMEETYQNKRTAWENATTRASQLVKGEIPQVQHESIPPTSTPSDITELKTFVPLTPIPGLYQAEGNTPLPPRNRDSIVVPPNIITQLETWRNGQNNNGRNLLLWGPPARNWLTKSMQKAAQRLQAKGEVVVYLEMKPADRPTQLMQDLHDCLARCVGCQVTDLFMQGNNQEETRNFLREVENRLHHEVLITIMVANVPMASFLDDEPASTTLRLLLSSPRFRTWLTTSKEPRRDFFKEIFYNCIGIGNKIPDRTLRGW